jgi:hypothetical protein
VDDRKPTREELTKIKNFAHGAFGYVLTVGQVLDVYNLARPTLVPVIRSEQPLATDIMRMAYCWREIRELALNV